MGNHWYTQEGEAQHFQPNGRGTTLREARKDNLLPSVTTIIGILDKPALVGWKLKQVTKACWYDNPNDYKTHEGYHKAMLDQALGSDVTGVDRGSLIHDAIEAWFRDDTFHACPEDIRQIAVKAGMEILEYCGYTNSGMGLKWPDGRDEFIPEQIVVGDGYAGKVDLHNNDFVIDWKTKDIKDGDTGKKLAYPEMAMQLSAYDAAIGCPESQKSRRCINVFVDRTTPGKVLIYEWSPEDIDLAWRKFCLLRDFWQLDKNYFPGE